MEGESNALILHLKHAYPWLRRSASAILAVVLAVHLVRVLNGDGNCLSHGAMDYLGWSDFVTVATPSSIDGHWFGDEWRTTGCISHQFFTSRVSQLKPCLEQQNIVFLGDSRARQLFQALIQHLDPTANVSQLGTRHSDAVYRSPGLDMQMTFYWHPELYSPGLSDLLTKLKYGAPTLTIATMGTWALKRGDSLDDMLQMASQQRDLLQSLSNVYWLPIGPVVEELLWPPRRNITNSKISDFNQQIAFLTVTDTVVPNSIIDIYQASASRTTDGLHYDRPLQQAVLTRILSHHCRHLLVNSAECCAQPARPTLLQASMLVLTVVLIISTLAVARARIAAEATKQSRRIAEGPLSYLTLVMTCMSLVWLADRTTVFPKEAKEYSHVSFCACIGLSLLVGLLTVKQSTLGQSWMHRDQTEEWKGWMQLCFLIYHYTGASQVLPIYVIIRVLVGAHIFLTGYGHYTHVLNGHHISWQRITLVSVVLFRLNVFVFFLCCYMDRRYQFYYFVPLISFWYLVLCGTTAVLPGWNDSMGKALIKIASLTLVTSAIWPSLTGPAPGFDSIFSLPGLYQIFQLNDSLHEWRFRSGLDRFALPAGMVAAILNHRYKEELIGLPNIVKGTLAAMSIITLLGYGWFATHCGSKASCNEWHVYLSPAAMAAFVVFRNVFSAIRESYSWFFAAIGKVSLELFLAQYHLWLAFDTQGLLVFVKGYPWVNTMLATVVFVAVANDLAAGFRSLSLSLTSGLVPSRAVLLASVLVGVSLAGAARWQL